MASLKKPNPCPCGGAILHLFGPERWECSCGAVLAKRPKKRPLGICKCGAKKEDKPFKTSKNMCMDCYNAYMRDWNVKTNTERVAYKKRYYAENRDRIRSRANAYYQSSIEAHLLTMVSRYRSNSRMTMSGKRRKTPLEFNLTKDDILGLWTKQSGLCAISGVPMDHKWNLYTTASLDRIDSAGGYTLDNVQLVCKFINLGKNTGSNSDALAFIELIRSTKPYAHGTGLV